MSLLGFLEMLQDPDLQGKLDGLGDKLLEYAVKIDLICEHLDIPQSDIEDRITLKKGVKSEVSEV